MKITRISAVVYRQQLKPGGVQPKFAGEGRNAFETLLTKVETDSRSTVISRFRKVPGSASSQIRLS